jgi:hypothetical protein
VLAGHNWHGEPTGCVGSIMFRTMKRTVIGFAVRHYSEESLDVINCGSRKVHFPEGVKLGPSARSRRRTGLAP